MLHQPRISLVCQNPQTPIPPILPPQPFLPLQPLQALQPLLALQTLQSLRALQALQPLQPLLALQALQTLLPTPVPSQLQDIEDVISLVEASAIDIAPTYDEWLTLGFALVDALGENGRSCFHRISRFHPNYSQSATDKQFSACLASHGHGVTIRSFFHLAKTAGITLPSHRSDSKFRQHSASGESGGIGKDGRNASANFARFVNSANSARMSEFPQATSVSKSEEFDEAGEMPTFSNLISDTLPAFFAQIVGLANSNEDADLLLLGSLAVVSACLPGVHGIYGEREVFPNLFVFITAQASAGKGRLSLCKHIVQPIHDELKQLYAAELEEYKQKKAEYNADKKNNEPPKEPLIKTLLIPANSSATSVYQILNDNGGVGLMFETEGDTLANTFKSDHGNFSDGLRKAFHHEMISYSRRTPSPACQPCCPARLSKFCRLFPMPKMDCSVVSFSTT